MRSSFCAAVLVVLAFAQRAVLAASLKSETYRDVPFGFARRTFHNVPIDVLFSEYRASQLCHVAFLLVAALQACALFLLARDLRSRTPSRAVLGVLCACAVAMAAEALQARQMFSSDVYAYAGYAKLGMRAAYAPPNVPFPAAFAPIDGLEGTPLPVCFYGPVWLVLARLFAGGAPSIISAIVALRVLGLLTFAIVLVLLYRRGLPVAALAVLALDPAIYSLYVSDAHNDLIAAAFVIAALAAVRRVPLAAAVFVACAALVKLPFLAYAFLVFAGRDALVRRFGWVALCVVLTAAGTVVLIGPHFALDVLHRLSYGQYKSSDGTGYRALVARLGRIALALVAGVSLVLAFVRQRYVRGAAPAFASLSTLFVYPWYVIGGLPYAAFDARALTGFGIAFPVLAAIFEQTYPAFSSPHLAAFVLLAFTVVEIRLSRGSQGAESLT